MRPSVLRACAGIVALAALASLAPLAGARDTASTLPQVTVRELPQEVREVLERIHRGGPFPYDRDGVTFGNRERVLPWRPRGYYHEYTVRTPGERTRGARRIVCGGPRSAPDACFYSDDHYRSFRQIQGIDERP
jgi:ribonuclease T1